MFESRIPNPESRRSAVLVLSLLIFCSVALIGDDGMWTFDNPPRALIKEKYGFDLTDQWLEHLRLASARLGDGGSGSFVSPDGLIFTNQHVGRGQVTKLSTPDRNLVRDGFYAATKDQELKCPDLEVNILMSYEDVTARVQAAVTPGASGKDANDQRKAEMSAIEKACAAATGLKCDVVTLYSGGEYWLYRNKRYTDIRLVFAPEEQIAYFGGDYDNFTYPRWNFDVTFLRAYENGQPARPPSHLTWSKAGAAEGELIFVSGYPGSTARLLTVAQLAYQRDVGNPLQMEVWKSRAAALESLRGPRSRAGATLVGRPPEPVEFDEARRRSAGRPDEPSHLRQEGKGRGGPARQGQRQRRVEGAATPPAWDEVAAAYAGLPEYAKRLAYSTFSPIRLANMASTLVRYAEEVPRPSARRYPEFTDSRLEGGQVRPGLVGTGLSRHGGGATGGVARGRGKGVGTRRSVRHGGARRVDAGLRREAGHGRDDTR